MRKGILEELNKSSVTVTDIANQSWCEYKVFLSCTQKEGQTKAMRIGEAIHMNLQKEVYKELTVEPVNYPDVFYKNAYENILTMKSVVDNGKGRELKIEGDIDGFTIRGKIDELLVENSKEGRIRNLRKGCKGRPDSESKDNRGKDKICNGRSARRGGSCSRSKRRTSSRFGRVRRSVSRENPKEG